MADAEAPDGLEFGLLPEGVEHRYLVALAAGQRIPISLDETRESVGCGVRHGAGRRCGRAGT